MADILERAEALLASAGWRTIDTAPRDGTHILVCNAAVLSPTWRFMQSPPTVAHWFEWDRPKVEGGFFTSVNEREPEYAYPATHWQPLHEPDTPDPLSATVSDLIAEVRRLREALDIQVDSAYRNGLNQAARIISQYEMENKAVDGIKHVAAVSARLTEQIIEARKERKARALSGGSEGGSHE